MRLGLNRFYRCAAAAASGVLRGWRLEVGGWTDLFPGKPKVAQEHQRFMPMNLANTHNGTYEVLGRAVESPFSRVKWVLAQCDCKSWRFGY